MVLLRQLAICVADAARILLVPGNAENQIVVLHHHRAPSAGTSRGDGATVGPGVRVRKTVSGEARHARARWGFLDAKATAGPSHRPRDGTLQSVASDAVHTILAEKLSGLVRDRVGEKGRQDVCAPEGGPDRDAVRGALSQRRADWHSAAVLVSHLPPGIGSMRNTGWSAAMCSKSWIDALRRSLKCRRGGPEIRVTVYQA